MKQIIVQISGKQGSGKSTLAEELAKRLAKIENVGVAVMAYADPIYKLMRAVQVNCMEFGLPVPTAKDGSPLKDGELLQVIATWGRRKFGEDVWVKAMANRITKTEAVYQALRYKAFVFLVPDLRFVNEYNAYPNFRYRLNCPEHIRKERILNTPGQSWRENTQHESEVGLDHIPPNGWNNIFNTDMVTTDTVATLIMRDLVGDGPA